MKRTNQELHQECINFINNNINAKTSEIPNHLLEHWYYPDDITDYFEKSSNLSSFFLFQHAFDTYNKTLGKEIKLSSLDAIATFGMFQIIIGIALGKETGLTCNPIDLFDFDNYSKLNIIEL